MGCGNGVLGLEEVGEVGEVGLISSGGWENSYSHHLIV